MGRDDLPCARPNNVFKIQGLEFFALPKQHAPIVTPPQGGDGSPPQNRHPAAGRGPVGAMRQLV